MLRVVVAVTSPVIREGLCRVLAGAKVIVVAVAALLTGTLGQLRQHKPDVVLLSADAALASKHALLTAIHSEFPGLGIIVVDTESNAAHLAEAMAHGACGYLGQGTTREGLLLAVQAAASGYALADRATLGQLLPALSTSVVRGAQLHGLTAREGEVLDLLSRGLSNEEIASALTISPSTAKTHMAAILRKLGLHDRLQAAMFGRAHGFGRRRNTSSAAP